LTKIKKLCILIAGGVEGETKKKGGESMEKKEKSKEEGLTHRWVGELLAELTTTSEPEATLSNYISKLPPEDQKWIWLPYAIKLAQLGQKEKAIAKVLQLDFGIKEVTKDEALTIALSNSGLVAQVGEKFYAYDGSNPAVRKLMHELRK
jgi:hypothetical protein